MRKVSKVLLSLVFMFTCIVSIGDTTQEVKAATEKVITELNETVAIFPLNGYLIIETEDIKLEKVSLDKGSTWFDLAAGKATIYGEGWNIEGKEILLSYIDGSGLCYTLKELPLENDEVTVSPTLTTINDGEYYTHYSTRYDGYTNPLRLNHFLIIEDGGVLQTNGGNASGFSIGYQGEGMLQINRGGIFIQGGYFAYHGSLVRCDGSSKGIIDVNGGLLKTNTGQFGFALVAESMGLRPTGEGKLHIRNKGKVSIATTSRNVFLGYVGDTNEAITIGKIELEEGELNISTKEHFFLGCGEPVTTNNSILGEIKIHLNQSIIINGIVFKDYEDNLNQITGVLKRSNNENATSGIYYNWNGENGYSYDTEVIYNYGDTIDIDGNEWDISALDTKQPGVYVIDAKDQSAFNAKLQANGYFTKDNIVYVKKVTVNKATIVDKEDIVENILYGDNLELPSTVEVELNNGDKINTPVTWDITSFSNQQPGEQTVIGVLGCPDYVDETSDKTITANITVGKATITGKQQIEKNIQYGDDFELPATVEVELNNGDKVDVPVVWNTSSFNNQQLGEQTVTGELTYPDYVDEESDKEVTAKITVKEVKLEVTGLPEKVYVGDVFTLTPTADTRVKGDGWDYDEDIFDVTFNSPATFTAKKAGETTITYTSEEGQVVKLSVVVLEKEETDKPTPPSNPDKETTNGTDVKDTSSTTKTVESGDTTNRYLFLSLLVISFGVIIVSKKKSKSN